MKTIPIVNIDFNRFSLAFKNIVHQSFHAENHASHPFITGSDVQTIKNLANNQNLVVCPPDKGRGVVLLDRNTYISKVTTLLNDPTKFRLSDFDPSNLIVKLEDKLNRTLRSLKDQLGITLYNNLFASGSSISTLYGSPKIHKRDCPVRPILAAYSSHNYNLAKFINSIINPFASNQYTVKNSYDFTKLINSFQHSGVMVSFDIESLFTNVPLKETIDIILNYVYSQTPPINLPRKSFKKLLELSVYDSFFLFNNQIYEQLDGVAMGSPLGPSFANIFLCYLEATSMFQSPSTPILYRRYVDDIFCIFNTNDDALSFCKHLNSLHPNLKFTVEFEDSASLPFLDILITRSNGLFSTSVFRKKSTTPLSMNFYSFSYLKYKISAVRTLIHRAYYVSSSYFSFHKEIVFLTKYFSSNGFPVNMVYELTREFLSSIFQPKPMITTVPKDIKYIYIPYIGNNSLRLRNHLNRLLHKHFPSIEFRYVLTNPFKISSLFRYKDRLPWVLRSNVVYLYKCPSCGMEYVGSTTRQLFMRICEHSGSSFRTGLPLSGPIHSRIFNHSLSCNIKPTSQQFKILSSTKDPQLLRILESLYIHKLKPQINMDLPPFTLNIV